MPEIDEPQAEPIPVNIDPSAQTGEPATETVVEPAATEPVADAPRDEQGRFLPQTPLADAEPDPLARFSPQLVELARSAYLTDEQIAGFTDPSMLHDVVRGRIVGMAPPPAQPAAAPQVPQVEPELAIDDFALQLDEEAGEEVGKPVKSLVEYVNKLKSGLVDEVHKLRKQNAELTAGMTQSASAAQRAAVQQQTTFWDQVASSVPGLVDAVGRPSSALGNLDGPQGREWSQLAPLIAARAQSQGVPEHLIDFSRATREAWAAYRAIGNNNGKTSDTRTAPGMAAQPAARRSVAPAPKANMSVAEDQELRLAVLENAFAAAGGNPFASDGGGRVI